MCYSERTRSTSFAKNVQIVLGHFLQNHVLFDALCHKSGLRPTFFGGFIFFVFTCFRFSTTLSFLGLFFFLQQKQSSLNYFTSLFFRRRYFVYDAKNDELTNGLVQTRFKCLRIQRVSSYHDCTRNFVSKSSFIFTFPSVSIFAFISILNSSNRFPPNSISVSSILLRSARSVVW